MEENRSRNDQIKTLTACRNRFNSCTSHPVFQRPLCSSYLLPSFLSFKKNYTSTPFLLFAFFVFSPYQKHLRFSLHYFASVLKLDTSLSWILHWYTSFYYQPPSLNYKEENERAWENRSKLCHVQLGNSNTTICRLTL